MAPKRFCESRGVGGGGGGQADPIRFIVHVNGGEINPHQRLTAGQW